MFWAVRFPSLPPMSRFLALGAGELREGGFRLAGLLRLTVGPCSVRGGPRVAKPGTGLHGFPYFAEIPVPSNPRAGGMFLTWSAPLRLPHLGGREVDEVCWNFDDLIFETVVTLRVVAARALS